MRAHTHTAHRLRTTHQPDSPNNRVPILVCNAVTEMHIDTLIAGTTLMRSADDTCTGTEGFAWSCTRPPES